MWIENEAQRTAYRAGIGFWTLTGLFLGTVGGGTVCILAFADRPKDVDKNLLVMGACAAIGGVLFGVLAAIYGKRYRWVVSTSSIIPALVGLGLVGWVISGFFR